MNNRTPSPPGEIDAPLLAPLELWKRGIEEVQRVWFEGTILGISAPDYQVGVETLAWRKLELHHRSDERGAHLVATVFTEHVGLQHLHAEPQAGADGYEAMEAQADPLDPCGGSRSPGWWRGGRAAVSGVEGLQQVGRFGAAHFADDDVIGPVPQGVAHEVADRERSLL